jgi:hypothetical protein
MNCTVRNQMWKDSLANATDFSTSIIMIKLFDLMLKDLSDKCCKSTLVFLFKLCINYFLFEVRFDKV